MGAFNTFLSCLMHCTFGYSLFEKCLYCFPFAPVFHKEVQDSCHAGRLRCVCRGARVCPGRLPELFLSGALCALHVLWK